MAIVGIQNINIGLPNESTGSDSLYDAFTKTQNNFQLIASSASPYTNFIGNGVNVTTDVTSGTVRITNTGVTNIIAGTNITISQANGNVTISSTGGGGGGNGGGSVTSVKIGRAHV